MYCTGLGNKENWFFLQQLTFAPPDGEFSLKDDVGEETGLEQGNLRGKVLAVGLVVVHDETVRAAVQLDWAFGQEGNDDGHLVAAALRVGPAE